MSVHASRDWFGLAGFEPAAEQKAGTLFLLETVGSTSDFLLGRGGRAPGRVCRWDGWGWQAGPLLTLEASRPPAPGTVAAAHRQTRGRGRHGRTWRDVGGLHLSWTFRTLGPALAGGLAVWIGLIVAETLEARYGGTVGLKWPNDLVCGGRKLGGLLLDRTGPETRPVVVAGLGLNLEGAAADLPRSLRGHATSLQSETGRAPRPGAVAGAVLARLGRELPRFEAEGWGPYRRALRRHDWLRGRRVGLTAGGLRVEGTAEGIDGGGALRLRRDRGGTLAVTAGDVHVAEISGEDAVADPGR